MESSNTVAGGEAGEVKAETTGATKLPSTVTMSGVIGNIEIYNFDEDNFNEYIERFEYIFTVNKVSEDKMKIALIMSMAGKEFHSKVNSIIMPKKPTEYSFDGLVTELKKHFSPKTNIRYERYKFMSRKFEAHETLSDFIVDLKFLADSCEFNNFLDHALSDKLIWSVNPSIQKRLLDEPISKTFQEICSIALSMEMVAKNVQEMQGGLQRFDFEQDQKRVNKTFQNYAKGASTSRGYNNIRITKRTGSSDEKRSYKRERSEERADQVQCYRCQRFGHMSRDCFNNRRRPISRDTSRRFSRREERHPGKYEKRSSINQMEEIEEYESSEGRKDDEISLYASRESLREDEVFMNNLSMGQTNRGKFLDKSPLILTFFLDNWEVPMEIDSGASYSVISWYMYEQYFKDKMLRQCTVPLCVISGSKLVIRGEIDVNVKSSSSEKYFLLSLIVIESNTRFTPLLGRNWLSVLLPRWKSFFKVNAISKVQEEEQEFNMEILKSKFPKVFDEDYTGCIEGYEANIVMDEHASPVFCGPYTVPYGLREKVNKEIDRLVGNGILEPVSFSNWASPMVVVEKANGDIRLCMDCKVSLNKFVKNNYYNLPLVEDLLHEFQGCSFFSMIDLTGAFTQVKVSKKCQEVLTINTQRGLFRSTRLTFGIKSAPCIFQNIIDSILRDMKYTRPYLDDILIGGRTREECRENTMKVLRRLDEFNVKANRQKCKFLVPEIKYLGFSLSKRGIRPTKDKLDAVRNAPSPHDLTSLKAYLGLLNFYGSFIRNLSTELSPLYNLTKKNVPFVWDETCQKAFERSKLLLSEDSLLVQYNSDTPLGIVCDASPYGVGAVLFHIDPNTKLERPIKFVSGSLSETERRYSQLEREALAIVFAMRKFHKFVYGKRFILYSDHKPLQFIFGEKKLNSVSGARIQRWCLFLTQYDYEICHRKGSNMGNADGLSRVPLNKPTGISEDFINFNSITGDLPLSSGDLAEATKNDENLKEVLRYIESDNWPKILNSKESKELFRRKSELSIIQNCICIGSRLVIPNVMKHRVLEILHGDHIGVVRMKSVARGSVWWYGIDRSIEYFVKSCDVCQQIETRGSNIKPTTWPLTVRPLERIHVDFFYFQNKQFFLLMDSYSKWIEIFIMNKTVASEVIDKLKRVFSTFGIPEEMVSDNGPPFKSRALKMFCKVNGINFPDIPTYHPASNGSAERCVGTAKKSLKKAIIDKKNINLTLENIVSNFLFHYRNTPCTVTGKSPSEMLFLFKPRTFVEMLKPNKVINTAENTKSQNLCLRRNEKVQDSVKHFDINQKVWYHSRFSSLVKWLPAVVVKKVSRVIYVINVDGFERRAHGSQLKERVSRFKLWDYQSGKIEHTPKKRRRSGSENDINDPVSKRLRPRHLLRAPDRYLPSNYK